MSELERIEMTPVEPGIRLGLYHYTGTTNALVDHRTPILLLHGASANHQTFVTGEHGGLARYLAAYHDVWLLDWRGSGLVLDDEQNKHSLNEYGDAYNFNAAASCDVPVAIDIIRRRCNSEKVSALGFCMGSAVIAEAVALGHVTSDALDCLILMTLGLFFETPVDGRLKCEDRILERLRYDKTDPAHPLLSIDPRVAASGLRKPWPNELDVMYQHWPSALKWHEATQVEGEEKAHPLDPVGQLCNRLSFMYGMPYNHGNLVDEIHKPASGEAVLPMLFGAIPLHMYIHGARNIRQGQATTYPTDDKRSTGLAMLPGNEEYVSDKACDRFRSLRKVTLVTGALNRLWHRDSIDRMYEWLRRGLLSDSDKIQKHIIPAYGHQDLLWGKCSPQDVFPKIREGLSV
jgi:pimeloyl-ACP methyl ester carboxylesterase